MYDSGFGYKDDASIWRRGCTQWVRGHVKSGMWSAYYVNFMFEPLPGNEEAVLAQMRRAIEKFYGRFSTRFDRKPRSNISQWHIPLFMLFPDKPAWKGKQKATIEEVTFNAGGLHYNGAMLVPEYSRFHGCPIEHLTEKQHVYVRHGISRIHAEPIYKISGMSDYACKTIKWSRADEKHIIILPRSVSELPDRD